jgi:transcriptional regulator with XRE-family HTH domain
MAYSEKMRGAVKAVPAKTIGARLARLAIKKGISVQEVAKRTGASRTTVYNWFLGGDVSNAYLPRVERLAAELTAAV